MAGISSSTLAASQEYLGIMPKRKLRIAGYVRESDDKMALDTITMESQAKAIRQYAQKEGYVYDVEVHEYREAKSGYKIPYLQRPTLQKLLKAATRKEFDVLVLAEIRALSRQQVEVFIIYDTLKKCGVRLETVNEKFDDDAMGRLLLGLLAANAEMERENTYSRMERGKRDRIEIGNAPPNGHRCYGYIVVDTEKEVKGRYEFNHAIVHVDGAGEVWTEYKVRMYILEQLASGGTVHGVTNRLNDLGIPPPRKSKKGTGCWTPTTVHRMVESRMNVGEVWVNKYKRDGKRNLNRPKEEWIRLPDCPAYIDENTYQAIQRIVKNNRQDSLRNNQHPEELGLLRSGYIFCGICGRRMILKYPSEHMKQKNGNTPVYRCQQNDGKTTDVTHNHRTQIHMYRIDEAAKEKIVEVLLSPEVVRAKVEELREANTTVVDSSQIEETVENIKRSMSNLLNLAQDATDDETMALLKQRLNNLEKQKRHAQSLLYDVADDAKERAEIEKEIRKFEEWVEETRPLFTDPSYLKIASYEELRFAVFILGLRVTVYPTREEYPYRYQIDVTVPEIMKKADIMLQPIAGWRGRLAIHEVHVCLDG